MKIDPYIPHKPPFKLVQTLLEASHERVVAGAEVAPDNVFFDARAGGVPTWAGLEYMAQTAAAWVGLEDERCGRPVQPAFLISSRHFSAHRPVMERGMSLEISVEPSMIEGPVVAFSGRIDSRDSQGRTPIAEAIFSAYRPDDVEAYLAASDPNNY